jgi:hypothetical protein
MKRIIMLSTLAAAMALMLALAGSASAAEPLIHRDHIEATGVIANCGDFMVLDDYELDVRTTTFFDRAGNPDSVRVQEQFRDFFYNSKTGEGFAETSTLVFFRTLESYAVVGVGIHVTVPGEGVVLLDAGRLIVDEDGIVFEAGQHQILGGNPDTEKFCAALA